MINLHIFLMVRVTIYNWDELSREVVVLYLLLLLELNWIFFCPTNLPTPVPIAQEIVC